jgi:Uma2 family endonuclease
VKLPHYATAGIPEYWIANLKVDEVLAFREPSDGAYRSETTFRRGDSIAVAAFPNRVFMLDEIIG